MFLPTYLTLGDRSQRLDQLQPLCITFLLSNFRQPRHGLLHQGLHNTLELPVFLTQQVDGSVELDIVPSFIALV